MGGRWYWSYDCYSLVIGFVLCCVNFRLREEPHTVEEYSGIGLTSDWYALSLK